MSASILPTELLLNIFGNLGGKDLLACKAVCRRWDDTVDGLGDKVWRKICELEYSELYEEAYRKASLSWCELYRSLSLWNDIAVADFTVHQLPAHKTKKFHILSNSILSCAQSKNNSGLKNPYDTIAYYDLVKLKKLPREVFHMPFDKYAENDNLLVIDSRSDDDDDDRTVRVMCKANTTFVELRVDLFRPWLLYKNEVLYERSYEDYGEFWHVKLLNNNGHISLRDEMLSGDELGGDIGDVSYVNGQLHIFKTYDGYMSIRRLVDNDFHSVCEFASLGRGEDPIQFMKRYGFMWWSPHIYYWLAYNYEDYANFTRHDVGSAFTYGKIVIVGTRNALKLHIFYDPYGPDGKLELDKSEPVKTIDLLTYKIHDKDLERFRERHHVTDFSYIENIDVIETANGHKIVFLYCKRVFVIELKHDLKRKRTMPPPLSVSPKLQRLEK